MKFTDNPIYRKTCIDLKAKRQNLRQIIEVIMPELMRYDLYGPEIFTDEVKDKILTALRKEDFNELKHWLEAHEHLISRRMAESINVRKESHGLD